MHLKARETAVMVIDMTIQERKYHQIYPNTSFFAIQERISILMDRARAVDIPIIHMIFDPKRKPPCPAFQHTTNIGLELMLNMDCHHEFFDVNSMPQIGDWCMVKNRMSAFVECRGNNNVFIDPVRQYVRGAITTLIVCGVETSMCVETTAIDAKSEHKYRVFVPQDTTTELHFDNKQYSIEYMKSQGIDVPASIDDLYFDL